MDNKVGASYFSLFGVSSGYGKVVLGPRTVQLISQKVDYWTDGDNFVPSSSR